MNLSVIIPLFNEEPTLATLLDSVLRQSIVTEVVVVDDGSHDRSFEIAQNIALDHPRLKIIRHPRNLGKGAAIRTALPIASGEIVLIQDADLEYDPSEYPKLISPLLQRESDAVYGTRFRKSESHHSPYLFHRLANHLLTHLFNRVTGLALTDLQTCFKAIRRETLSKIILTESGFGFDTELSLQLAAMNARILEVPISYHGRTYQAGKKIRCRDGFRSLALLFQHPWRSRGPSEKAL
jgi:glycosyltransferase involved in cell wall biosynthesis